MREVEMEIRNQGVSQKDIYEVNSKDIQYFF